MAYRTLQASVTVQISTQLHLGNSRPTVLSPPSLTSVSAGWLLTQFPPFLPFCPFLNRFSQSHRSGSTPASEGAATAGAGQPRPFLTAGAPPAPAAAGTPSTNTPLGNRNVRFQLQTQPRAVFPLPSAGRGARRAEGRSAAPLPHRQSRIHLSHGSATAPDKPRGLPPSSGPAASLRPG